MATKYLVQHRRGTAAQWAEQDTLIPREGEIVIEIDEVNSLHKLKIGDGVHTYAELAYLKAGDEIVSQVLAEAKPRVITVELSESWAQDSDDKYYQTLTLEGITNHSRLDLQPTADMLAEFKQLGLVFVTENNGGTITVYSVGNMPLKAYTMQATIIETECDGEDVPVFGVPVGTPAAQPDWDQNDPTKVDYVKNRTHWKEFKEVSPLTTITPFYYEPLGVPMGNMADFDIVIGNKYKVTFDGVDYVCEAFMATMAGMSAPAFGNTIVAGGADTGDPFAIFKLAEDNWTTIIFLDMNQHSVQVSEETFNKIPTAFLQTLEETRTKKVTLLPYQEAVYESFFDGYITPLNFSIELGATYEVNYNGTLYTCKAINGTYGGISIIAVGNLTGSEGKEPFVMTDCAVLGMPGYLGILVFDSPDSVNIGIEGYKYDKIAKEIIPTLEEMYCNETLIFSDTITLNADGEGFPISEGLTVGYTYTINWNGVDYSCKAIDSAILGEPGFAVLGNIDAILESGNTGEPFAIVSGFDSNSSSYVVAVRSLDGSTTVNLTIMHQDITKISKKLLPTIDEMFFEKNEKLVPTEFVFSPQNQQQYTPYIELIPNDTYIVNWDGVEYTCTAVELIEDAFVIGNIGAISGESTGEPFLIMSAIEDGTPLTALMRVEGPTTVTVSITHAKINKVPKECLPDDLNLDVDVSGVLTEAKEYTDTKADTTLTDAKAYTDSAIDSLGSTVSGVLTEAKEYTDSKSETTLTEAKEYTDSKSETTLTEAKEYTDSKSETTLTEAKEYTDTAISSLGSVTPNWEASEGEDGYILNRTHYVDGYEHDVLLVDTTKTSILTLGSTLTSTKDDVKYTAHGYYLVSGIDILVGETYRVIFDDIEYNIVATQDDVDSVPHKFINSPHSGHWIRGEYNANIPFAIDSYEKDGKIRTVIYIKDTNTHTFSIYGTREAVHKLDKKYLPDVMFAENPVCTGSFSMSRSSNTIVGTWSSTLGYDNEASTTCAHAEGYRTLASGYASHAEGSFTTASGDNSHAEGSFTTASGDYSHAEGRFTTASGDNQHVQGKSNIKDTANKYAHIVGNGESETARSNAHTLDWDGNAWFQGDVYIGSTSGTNKDEGSVKLASEAYVDNALAIITIPELDAICVIPLEAGLYQDGAMTMSWDELIDAGIVKLYAEGTMEASGKNSLIGELVISDSITYIIGITDNVNLTSVIMSDSVTECSAGFENCTSLTEVVLSKNLTKFGYLMFKGCTSLNEFSIPSHITHLGSEAFSGCTNLTNVTIPFSVTRIPGKTFYNCTSLTSIVIPNSITYIEDFAFQNCTALSNISFEGTTTEWQNIGLGYKWNQNVPATQVICSDGTITL